MLGPRGRPGVRPPAARALRWCCLRRRSVCALRGVREGSSVRLRARRTAHASRTDSRSRFPLSANGEGDSIRAPGSARHLMKLPGGARRSAYLLFFQKTLTVGGARKSASGACAVRRARSRAELPCAHHVERTTSAAAGNPNLVPARLAGERQDGPAAGASEGQFAARAKGPRGLSAGGKARAA